MHQKIKNNFINLLKIILLIFLLFLSLSILLLLPNPRPQEIKRVHAFTFFSEKKDLKQLGKNIHDAIHSGSVFQQKSKEDLKNLLIRAKGAIDRLSEKGGLIDRKNALISQQMRKTSRLRNELRATRDVLKRTSRGKKQEVDALRTSLREALTLLRDIDLAKKELEKRHKTQKEVNKSIHQNLLQSRNNHNDALTEVRRLNRRNSWARTSLASTITSRAKAWKEIRKLQSRLQKTRADRDKYLGHRNKAWRDWRKARDTTARIRHTRVVSERDNAVNEINKLRDDLQKSQKQVDDLNVQNSLYLENFNNVVSQLERLQQSMSSNAEAKTPPKTLKKEIVSIEKNKPNWLGVALISFFAVSTPITIFVLVKITKKLKKKRKVLKKSKIKRKDLVVLETNGKQ